MHSLNYSLALHEAKWNFGKVKTKPMQWLHYNYVGGSREVCRGTAMCFASFACYLACFVSLPPTVFGKYSFSHTGSVSVVLTGALKVGCDSVAMVTLLLRRLLLSSVATFMAPTLQYFNYWLRVLTQSWLREFIMWTPFYSLGKATAKTAKILFFQAEYISWVFQPCYLALLTCSYIFWNSDV